MKDKKLKKYENLINNMSKAQLITEKDKIISRKGINEMTGYKLSTIAFVIGSSILGTEIYDAYKNDEFELIKFITGTVIAASSIFGFIKICNKIELEESKLLMLNEKIVYLDSEKIKENEINNKLIK